MVDLKSLPFPVINVHILPGFLGNDIADSILQFLVKEPLSAGGLSDSRHLDILFSIIGKIPDVGVHGPGIIIGNT